MRGFLHQCLTFASVAILAASCVPRLLVSEVPAADASGASIVGSDVSGAASVSVTTKDSRVTVVTADTLSDAVTSGVAATSSTSTSSEQTKTATPRRLSYTLKFGKREMSGIMVAKPLADGSYRTLGTTIFGMTVFDMTVSKDSYTMNSCAEFLENKAFASFLANKIRKALY